MASRLGPLYLVRFVAKLHPMKIPLSASALGPASGARFVFPRGLAALLAGLLSLGLSAAVGRAQPADDDEQGGQVLTRGPVHEAFAGVVSFNPEPGIVVPTAPPELIEEIPPEERPEGDDVAWIPGYWAWDDERNDFLWISGTWRTVPPGREWMAGYWRDTGQGSQWISGYWADAEAQEITYLPPPPQTLEIGANLDAPSDDYGWTPGCWVWQQDRYAWRAGYWAQGRADWVWVPAYYVWTPRGVIFVDGFWDYPVERRGLLFAPIYYESRGYARRGYSYTPRIAISLSFFNDNLFLRPSYHHYYFGDYYGSRYEQGGFFMSFSYQSSRRGYDPFYARDRWAHRGDRDWARRHRAAYQYRRDHVAARPPRTWAAQLSINARPASAGQVRLVTAVPLARLARSRDNSARFQAVAPGDRQRLAQRGREVQQSRDSRRSVEAQAVVTAGRNEGRVAQPARVPVPRSPIVGRPAAQRSRDQAPPARPPSSRSDPQAQPRNVPRGRAPDADRGNPAETRQRGRNAPEERRAPERAREDSPRVAPETSRQPQPEARQRARDVQVRAQVAEREREQAGARADATAARAREQAQRRAQQHDEQRAIAREEAQRKAQQGDQQSANAREAAQRQAQQQSEARTRARDGAPPPREERAREPGVRERNDATRRDAPAPARAQPGEDRRAQAAPAKSASDEKRQPAGKGRSEDGDDRKRDR